MKTIRSDRNMLYVRRGSITDKTLVEKHVIFIGIFFRKTCSLLSSLLHARLISASLAQSFAVCFEEPRNGRHEQRTSSQQGTRPPSSQALEHFQSKQREGKTQKITAEHDGTRGGSTVEWTIRIQHEEIDTGINQ